MKIWNNIYFSIIKGKISGNIDDSEVNLVILQSHKIHLFAYSGALQVISVQNNRRGIPH